MITNFILTFYFHEDNKTTGVLNDTEIDQLPVETKIKLSNFLFAFAADLAEKIKRDSASHRPETLVMLAKRDTLTKSDNTFRVLTENRIDIHRTLADSIDRFNGLDTITLVDSEIKNIKKE